MALTNKLTAIADAIREKTCTTDKMTLEQMATAIGNITGGGGSVYDYIPEEAFLISGDCSNMFQANKFLWFLERYKDKITTNNISTAQYMFYGSGVTSIPYELNFRDNGCAVSYMFGSTRKIESIPSIDFKHNTTPYSADNLFVLSEAKEIGTIKNLYPDKMNKIFSGCVKLRYLPEFENLNLDKIYTYNYANIQELFSNCHSLRSVPEELLKKLYAPLSSAYNCQLQRPFNNCFVLDEIRGLSPQTAEFTSNAFSDAFYHCRRIKNLIFDTQEDGTPYVAKWKNQTIALHGLIGYNQTTYGLFDYNSGITADKEVTDDASYQALKNDPDWFTCNMAYSRYNHDSAVNTINSLPDTSAYLATAGGTNTIKFNGAAGSATDGGAINTLTEEEIAVATAKGWTVTFA